MVTGEEWQVIGEALSIIAPVVIAVIWIEKRFRDSDRNAKACVEDALSIERESRTSALNAATATMKNDAARLERQAAGLHSQNAALQRDLTSHQLSVARELRDYPTKGDLTQFRDDIVEQIDKLETRFENVMGLRRPGGG
jgi:hypothetical protein